MTHAYDWALVRIVPDATTGDGEAVGVALHSRRAGVFAFRLAAEPQTLAAHLAARWPELDARLAACALRGAQAVAGGMPGAGPIALLPPSERFHWLVAVRSSVLQASPVRTGASRDPAAEADRIVRSLAFSVARDPVAPRGVSSDSTPRADD